MSRFSFVNGQFVDRVHAGVSIEDRGLLFGDSVYEVVCLIDGNFVDMDGHLVRLKRSMDELHIELPCFDVLPLKIKQLAEKNRLQNGQIYIQVTRGSAPRDFTFPKDTPASLFMMCKALPSGFYQSLSKGIKVITVPDIRWKRRDIKTTNLLAQVLAKQKASECGAKEAWMLDEGTYVTEGGSSNAWIVTNDGKLVTRQADHLILSGITRSSLLQIADEIGIEVEFRPFRLSEAYEAQEAFISSATTFATPVLQINEHKIGNGKIGPLTKRLLDHYIDYGLKAEIDYEWQAPF